MTMKTLKGPGLLISTFIDANEQLSTLDGICAWASSLGFKALQMPIVAPHVFDVELAAESQAYCDDLLGVLDRHGLTMSEIACQRQGQTLAFHPAYEQTLAHWVPARLRDRPGEWAEWSAERFRAVARASRRLGTGRFIAFSGSLLWPYFYPYPPLADGVRDAGFKELAKRWRPVLDRCDAEGIDVCFELHPTEDLHDGSTFERFLSLVDEHPRCNILYDPSHLLLQHVDYLGFLDLYAPWIKALHVKDAEFVRSPRTGVYGGYNDWPERAGRFRSPGDGQVDFKSIFARLTGRGFDGWATLEWECCFKNRYDGAREGAAFIRDHIIAVTDRPFDAGMKGKLSAAEIGTMLGLKTREAGRRAEQRREGV